MKQLLSQVPVKICISILLIETLLLSLMGVFYVRGFFREIDQRVEEKLALPGTLMSQRALNYDSVEDHQIIAELIQEEVLAAFVTNRQGKIFYAAEERVVGTSIERYLSPGEHHLLIIDSDAENRQITFREERGGHVRSSVSQIRNRDSLLGFLYIKINAADTETEKRNIVLLFVTGSLLTIVLTTLFEAVYIYRLVVPRIRHISTVLDDVTAGDLSTRVTHPGPEDEICTLMVLINGMLDTVSKTIDDLTTTQLALQESEERFRKLSDLLPEGVFELDIHGSFTYVNDHFCTVTGYDRDTIYREMSISDLLAAEDIERSYDNFRERLAGRLTGVSEYVARRKDGTTLPIMVNTVAIGTPDNPKGLRGIVVDLTEKNHLQQQLWQTQKMETIGRISSSIAHEFGNPLVGIHWLLEDLQKLPSLDDQNRQLIEIGLKECEKMKQHLSNFQAFAKPSSSRKTPCSINQILDDSLLFYNKRFADKKATVIKNCSTDLPNVTVIKDQIHQVFVNILMNAIDSLPETGGTITISTALHDDSVIVKIADTGRGIPEEDREHIFEPFFSTKPEIEGTGLGLYVSYLIIQNHKGEIRVDSTVGKGSTFTIKLLIETSPQPTSLHGQA